MESLLGLGVGRAPFPPIESTEVHPRSHLMSALSDCDGGRVAANDNIVFRNLFLKPRLCLDGSEKAESYYLFG